MHYDTVIYTKKDHIANIILNQPETDNIVNGELAREMEDICSNLNRDDDIYVAVITGAGDKVFCGGSQLERLLQSGKKDETSPEELKDISTRYHVAAAIAGVEKPVITAVNGDALGQGLELVLACDVRLASAEARFGFPQVSYGLIPMDGGTQRLSRLVGKGKALELVLTAETISAEEALVIGLVSQVIPPDKLAAEAEAMARTMCTRAPITLRYLKEAVNNGLDLTLEQGLRLEADLYFLLHTTADRTEGIKAFLEKRKPDFKGQ